MSLVIRTFLDYKTLNYILVFLLTCHKLDDSYYKLWIIGQVEFFFQLYHTLNILHFIYFARYSIHFPIFLRSATEIHVCVCCLFVCLNNFSSHSKIFHDLSNCLDIIFTGCFIKRKNKSMIKKNDVKLSSVIYFFSFLPN